MKANELQVGDYIIVNGITTRVEQVTRHKIGYHTKTNECRMHYARLTDVEHVEITEDVLEQNLSFGCNQMYGTPAWEYNIDNEYYLTINQYPDVLYRKWHIHVTNRDREEILGADFDYLHQLQQMVRFATWKELDVTK